jgi:lysylphosphatidylglycerol synthetase-like protein (DUF2156 family)
MAKKMAPPKILSPDAQLADHLKHAEHHLIAALKLFEKKVKPSRTMDFVRRLTTAQETTTTLLREELIRIRGPIKPSRR